MAVAVGLHNEQRKGHARFPRRGRDEDIVGIPAVPGMCKGLSGCPRQTKSRTRTGEGGGNKWTDVFM